MHNPGECFKTIANFCVCVSCFTQHYTKCSYGLHHSTWQNTETSTTFHRWGNWRLARSNNLPQNTKLGNGCTGLWEPWHSPSELPLIHSYLLACNVADCPLPRTWKCPFMDTEMGARPHPAAGLSGSHHAWVLVKRITFQVTLELGSEGCSLFDGPPILPASIPCHDVLDNHRYSRCPKVQDTKIHLHMVIEDHIFN